MQRVVYTLAVCLFLTLAACSTPLTMASQVSFSGVAYDTSKEPSVPGGYRTRSAFDEKHEGQAEQIKAQTLLNGIQAAQKDQYDFVAWSGPYPATLGWVTSYRGVTTGSKAYRGFEYVVRGWKSAEGNAPTQARPVSVALNEVTTQVRETASSSEDHATTPTTHFIWPVRGKLVTPFPAPIDGKPTNRIHIEAKKGAYVQAVEGGVVDNVVNRTGVYIKHFGGFDAMYWCVEPFVTVGTAIVAGQNIALAGGNGPTCRGSLAPVQFGLFYRSKAIDPMSVLPAQ